MRTVLRVGLLLATGFPGACQTVPHRDQPGSGSMAAHSAQVVTAGCATCIFDMDGVNGCKLAVEVDGRKYLVSGSGIDDHGDAHASDGLCNARRQAIVNGRIERDRFVADRIKLLPLEK